MIKKILGTVPNLITMCNLLSGCMGTYMAFHSDATYGCLSGMQWCWIFIGMAAVFDFCDGASARALHAYSEIGKQLDSLSDLVSFGIAPGMLVLNLIHAHAEHPWMAFAALLIPAAGAYRLAKFNVDTRQTTSFRGLPIPANAIFWIGATAWVTRYIYPGTAVMLVLLALFSWLMVSDMPMFLAQIQESGLARELPPLCGPAGGHRFCHHMGSERPAVGHRPVHLHLGPRAQAGRQPINSMTPCPPAGRRDRRQA